MASMGMRARVQVQGDYHLCSLPERQPPPEVLDSYLAPVWGEKQPLMAVTREQADGEVKTIAEGYEQTVVLAHDVDGKTVRWTERHPVIRSPQQFKAAEEGLHARLLKA